MDFDPSAENRPNLVPFEKMVTFFHELGHIMHILCQKSALTRFSALKAEKDFVEVPSKFLELWMEDYEIIGQISKHYKTA